MEEKKIKVAVGMSGGVDSSVAAKLLVDQGYEVVGFMMKFWADPKCLIKRDNACCDLKSLHDAKKVADKLDIPFYVLDVREKFKKEIVDYFIEEYKNNRTPNPCVVCNEKIKFGWFLEFTKSLGCQYVSTGHYARIKDSRNSKLQITNSKVLMKGIDTKKDQSYFLYRLNQEQLKHILLPLGDLTKDKVRALAKKWNLPTSEKKESQEICFVADDYREFLKRNLPVAYFKRGEIVNQKGEIVGYHQGLSNYTIGQRKGIDQTESLVGNLKDQRSKLKVTDKRPLYVVDFDKTKNQLIVGNNNDLKVKTVELKNINWIFKPKITDKNISVKIRYRSLLVPCKLNTIGNNKVTFEFFDPQRAITPGQSAVFYKKDILLGGGIIV